MPKQSPPVRSNGFVTRRAVCLSAVLLLNLLPGSSRADLFYKVEKVIRLTDSGVHPGADGTTPMSVTGLNANGWFAGYFPSVDANKPHAFVWNNDAQSFTDLNGLLAADSSMATCLNDNGTVAGIFWELGTYEEKGFISSPDGTVNTFTSPDGAGGNITAVTAINASGDLIGAYLAADGSTRGFIVQQANGPASVTDLGDLGQVGFYPYIWPNALNNTDQVVGNEYLFPNSGRGTSYTQGFFWDGGMTLIDVSGLSANWTAVALNNNGQAVGLYGMSTVHGRPFSVAGSYYWDGSNVTDLGDLGGGNGANVFTISNNNVALGTSISSDGTLHLFGEEPPGFLHIPGDPFANGITDLGSVSLFTGDAGFVPLGLTQPYTGPLGPSNQFYVAGFGTDAAGNTLSLLWTNNSIYSVVDLMPTYLSFSTISNAYGSMVLINASAQIACAGTDSNGNQMALLLSVDPDTDDDGLPDSWEMQYYGQLGVDKNALEAGGGGLTNWQAYEQGSDPNDFYNGQPPMLIIVCGDGQTGGAGGFVPQALTVQVTVNGQPVANAPVTFNVTQNGGQLQATLTSSPTTEVSVTANSSGIARTFFLLPNTPSTSCTVTSATGTGASQSTVPFTEISGAAGHSAQTTVYSISHMISTPNGDGTDTLTWINNTDDPIDIGKLNADGKTWTIIMTVPAGTTSCIVPSL